MKRTFLLLALLWATDAQSIGNPYGWTISASPVDPYVNTASANGAPATFFIWLACNNVPSYPDGTPRAQGFSAAEFALEFTGIIPLGATTSCFSTQLPPSQDFIVFCGGCPGGPVVVAQLVVLNLPGTICFAPSSNGVMGTVDCELEPTRWDIDWIGMDTTGSGAPCGTGPLCQNPVSVEPWNWGRIKSLYR